MFSFRCYLIVLNSNQGEPVMFGLRKLPLGALLLSAVVVTACDDDPAAPPALGVPSGLAAAAVTTNSLTLNWSAAAHAESYIVERASSGVPYAQVGTATSASFSDQGLAQNTEYRYRVAAVRGADRSAFSTEVLVTTQGPGPLGVPAGLAASARTSNSITLTWTAATNAAGYALERASTGQAYAQIATPTGTTFTDTNLVPNTEYRYRVAATRGVEKSAFGTEVVTSTTTNLGTATINADITTNRTLHADTTYTLSGFIHVTNGATLTIQPGTKLVGDFNTLGSALFVMRGAKIQASGTADKPIVFTSSQPVGSRRPGDWGGLIIVGNARINRSGQVILEGSNTGASNPAVVYSGGTDDADNSGTLRYVRVEFAGYAPAQDQELNSFTFAALGSGTTIEYLQSMSGLDDSFEWFGGTADGKYLVSYEAGDDHFDMSEGFRGRLQYVIAYQSKVLQPRAGAGGVSGDPQGIENDGCSGSGCDLGQNSTPFTTPMVANFTLVGTGPGVVDATSGGVGMVLRRGTGGYYVNGIVARWPKGAISVRDSANTNQRIRAGDFLISNVFVSDNNNIAFQAGSSNNPGTDFGAQATIAGSTAASTLFSALPTDPNSGSQFDWTPVGPALNAAGLSTFSGVLATKAGTFVMATAYVGAANPAGVDWWAGWTTYADD